MEYLVSQEPSFTIAIYAHEQKIMYEFIKDAILGILQFKNFMLEEVKGLSDSKEKSLLLEKDLDRVKESFTKMVKACNQKQDSFAFTAADAKERQDKTSAIYGGAGGALVSLGGLGSVGTVAGTALAGGPLVLAVVAAGIAIFSIWAIYKKSQEDKQVEEQEKKSNQIADQFVRKINVKAEILELNNKRFERTNGNSAKARELSNKFLANGLEEFKKLSIK